MPVLPSYPHMGAKESDVWRAFLASGHAPAGDVYYAARLGTPLPWNPAQGEYMRALIHATSRLRVDAVIVAGDVYWLFEVKIRAGLSALGQAMGYQLLFEDVVPGTANVLSCIVAWSSTIDLPPIATRCGIGLYLVTSKWGQHWNEPAFSP